MQAAANSKTGESVQISKKTKPRSRLTVVSCEAKEEAASSALTDSRLTRVSILQVQEL